MPLVGTMDVAAFVGAGNIREIHGFKTEPWVLKGAQILNVYYEINNDTIASLLPVTLRPVIPAYGMFVVTRYPDTPIGPFTIAEVRVGCRAGVRPRGFVLRAYVDSEAAANELAQRWGYPAFPAKVKLRPYHDRAVAEVVTSDGKKALEVEMLDREFISGGDVQYISSMHMARNKEDAKVIVVQVDPEWVFHKAERGRPHLIALDSKAWGVGDMLRADYPISATFTTCDVTLTSIRYICDPNQDAFRGTTQLAA
ncbi:MAG TPA: acetoacetate decarboxylase family protein [Candidatus Binataceae bacterium]|nr:acetoacetate decarboxylase family protein [Candidatus Binataceae bacterium]